MLGPCSCLDCKQQTLCFVVLFKTRTQTWRGTGSKTGCRDARDTRVLNDMDSSTVSTNCLKGCSFLPWNFYETVYQVPMLPVLKTKPLLLLS